MRIDLGFVPHQFQTEIYERRKRFTVVVAHRRFGKTMAAIMLLIASALRCTLPSPRFAYVAPFLKQARNVSWDYIRNFVSKIPGAEIREGDLSVNLPNGARITLYGADNAEGILGIYLDGVVLDEVANFKTDVWSRIIRPTLTDRKGWALFIGTPKGPNLFSDLYHDCDKPDNRAEWQAMIFPADETDRVSPEELESNRRAQSPAVFRQEYLCDFSAASDNILLTIDVVSAAAQKKFNPYEVAGMPKIVGVDIARFGDDRSVIQRRQGLCALEPIVMRGLDNMEVVGRLTAVIEEWQPDQVFIDAGRGEGVIDRVRQLGYSVIEVNFGGRPSDPSYVNKRSEMWDVMAKRFAAGLGIPNDPELKQDLVTPTYKFDAANRFALESKDDMRKRLNRSPDLGDALALTFALPFDTARSRRGNRNPYLAVEEWDPFREQRDHGWNA
jgi:Terminase large subunit, T4likevirus-type, N-terminal